MNPHLKVVMVHMPQLYLSVKYPLQFFVSYCMFTPLHSNTNQKLLESTSVIKIATDMDGAAYPSYCLKLYCSCQLC